MNTNKLPMWAQEIMDLAEEPVWENEVTTLGNRPEAIAPALPKWAQNIMDTVG